MTTHFEDILYEKREGVAHITINRPKLYNAFRATTCEEIISALKDADHDKAVCDLAIAKRSLNQDSDSIRGIGNLGFEAVALYYQTEESKEGVRAFLEKRKPNFRN